MSSGGNGTERTRARRGYIRLHRSLESHWIWDDPEYRAVWVGCLMYASWRKERVMRKGTELCLLPGQFVTSERDLARNSGMTRDRVRTLLRKLLDHDMLREVRRVHGIGTVYEVTNWTTYQHVPEAPQQAHRDPTNDGSLKSLSHSGFGEAHPRPAPIAHPSRSRLQPPKPLQDKALPASASEEEGRKEKDTLSRGPNAPQVGRPGAGSRFAHDFGNWYAIYPARPDDPAFRAETAYEELRAAGVSAATLLEACRRYKETSQVAAGYACHAHRFLSEGIWQTTLSRTESGGPGSPGGLNLATSRFPWEEE